MEKSGIVFDLQRTCFYDGPGIRTTVFFKGCPLHCLWCHNPESVSFKPQVSFNAERCVNCLACVEICPTGAQVAVDGRHSMHHALCEACGKCVSVCAFDALQRIGEQWTVSQVMAEVERDIDFYVNSGGGVTLSGGEPTAQFEFAAAILQACREKGIHTCIETCGFAPQAKYEQLFPLVDLFLIDYKATDSETHQRLTGVPNELILSNIDYLYQRGAKIILRCPLVPGVNDSVDHLAGIAAIADKYPDLQGIELMAYHDMGKDKGLRIGKEYALAEVETADETTKQAWLKRLQGLGCEHVIIG